MDVRIRFRELLKEKGLTTYAVARDSGDRVSLSTAYRLKRRDGKLETFSNDLLEALCDAFDVEPGELFERDKRKRGK
jgi:DNA-binding Xre family transcriptional regulator